MIAGETSGDRTLGKVLEAVKAPAFGIGGDALAAAGADLFAHVRAVSGMGAIELSTRLPAIGRALYELRKQVLDRRPKLALLASWSAANLRIGRWLRSLGTRVIWFSPPEIWAWRAGRGPAIVAAADVLVPTLPFEEPMWRSLGADARYLGHPAVDVVKETTHRDRSLLLLPGSRAAEVDRLLMPFVSAARRLDRDRTALLIAPGLPQQTDRRVRGVADRAGISTLEGSAFPPGFSHALVASGTASLEAALAEAIPVIAYRMHPVTMFMAKRLVSTEHFGLPNVVLARAGFAPAFPEHLQADVTSDRLAGSVQSLTDPQPEQAGLAACAQVQKILRVEGAGTFATRAAALVREIQGRAGH